jgi:hypothetical protein
MLKQFILGFLTVTFIVISTAVFTLDWFGGCGETFTFSDGSRHQGECIGRDILKTQLERLLP